MLQASFCRNSITAPMIKASVFLDADDDDSEDYDIDDDVHNGDL